MVRQGVLRSGLAIVTALGGAVIGLASCATGNDCTNCDANDRASVREPPAPAPALPSSGSDPEPEGPGAQPSTSVVPPEPGEAPEPDPSNDDPEGEPYGNCLESADVCDHGESPHCLVDDVERPTMAFCTSTCGATQECPPAPFGGTAPPSCLTLGGPGGECVLDCLNESCPPGMVCLPFGVCGYVTPNAENPYDECRRCDGDSSECLEASLGEVCLPECGDECPAARSGNAMRICVESEGRFGCALRCDGGLSCPDGMACVPYGFQSLCVWPYDDPCEELDCGADAHCELRGGQPLCVCDDDRVPDGYGNCVDPCSSCPTGARCETSGAYPQCVCDPPAVMNMGRCEVPVTDPCDPNPCQAPASNCVVADGAPTCTCPNPGEAPPECTAGCTATHYDGDEFEPNDCPEDTTLVDVLGMGDAASRLELDIGPELDDVDRFRLAPAGGIYWVLLEAPAPLCSLGLFPLPATVPFDGFGFGAQLPAAESTLDWVCSYDDALGGQTSYALGVLHFPVGDDLPAALDPDGMGGGDMSAEQMGGPGPVMPPLVPGRSIANRFDDVDGVPDVDAFAFVAELPITVRLTGQSATLAIEVLADGMLALEQSVDCGFSLEPLPCAELDGTGYVTVIIQAQQSEAAEQEDLDAWRLDW